MLLATGIIMVCAHFLGGEKNRGMWHEAFQLLTWLCDDVTLWGD